MAMILNLNLMTNQEILILVEAQNRLILMFQMSLMINS
jgi:hypothetical protein